MDVSRAAPGWAAPLSCVPASSACMSAFGVFLFLVSVSFALAAGSRPPERDVLAGFIKAS